MESYYFRITEIGVYVCNKFYIRAFMRKNVTDSQPRSEYVQITYNTDAPHLSRLIYNF